MRLACIDAPEMAQQPHGQRAREYVRMRLPVGSAVHLDVKTTDRYGRTVAEVISHIGNSVAWTGEAKALRTDQRTEPNGDLRRQCSHLLAGGSWRLALGCQGREIGHLYRAIREHGTDFEVTTHVA